MKRILALDGGGIRGVFSLQILARIEELFREKLDNQKLVLADEFDLIAGTSTGAIIATFLSWGLSVREIEALYKNNAATMFAAAGWIDLLKSKYNPNAIAGFFKEQFAEEDGTPALMGTSRLKTLLLIVMRNGSTGGSWPVTNNPKAKYNRRTLADGKPNLQCNLDFPLWRLLRASTAAPTFFPPEEIKIGDEMHLFMDGGMTPFNNPALITFLTATLPGYNIGWTAKREDIHLISVGTGLARARMPGKAADKMHLLDHLRYIAPALIGSSAWEQDIICRVLGDCVHGALLDAEIGMLEMPTLLSEHEQKFTYARYDYPLDERHPKIKDLPEGQFQLDNIELIPLLQELGAEYAEQHVRLEHFFPRGNGFTPCSCSVTPPEKVK
jgi:hypothetical protein